MSGQDYLLRATGIPERLGYLLGVLDAAHEAIADGEVYRTMAIDRLIKLAAEVHQLVESESSQRAAGHSSAAASWRSSTT